MNRPTGGPQGAPGTPDRSHIPLDQRGYWLLDRRDFHGNLYALEGYDRCGCGCKYWEYDQCVDCGAYSPRTSMLN